MLQIVIASILVGIALITIPAKSAKPMKDLCMSGQVLTMKIISWAMAIAPYAVFGLLADITIKTGLEALLSVGLYAITVLLGLACMLIVYLVLIGAFAKFNIFEFIKGVKEVQLLAFSTSSSAATMPFSIKAAEENLGVRPEISRFVVPLGATVNMDGTALYQAVAAVFLCQVFGIDLSLGETILLLVTTVGASIGTPATPGVGLVVLATILSGLGVPAEGIALIIGVDRILDMCRTTVNVTGDLTATAIMNNWVKPAKS
jgi:Na+/H+-dicarboxylate symporter